MTKINSEFETAPLADLLRKQAIPAAVGIFILSLYGIVDTIFVGRWVGSIGIAAITVVMPITFLVTSVGLAIGVGGSSVLSRAMGDDNKEKVLTTFGNQIFLVVLISVLFSTICFIWLDEILILFGAKGDVLEPAIVYCRILLYGLPFLAWTIMSNNVIRAEGHPKVAMSTLIIPSILNIILDPILIIWMDMGIEGAAWATTISFFANALYTLWFFMLGSRLKLELRHLVPNVVIIREISKLGSVSFARQGTISLLFIVLNNSLFAFGGEIAIATYGIINRVAMLVNFPIVGITQGFMPIAGFNYGAKKWSRVDEIIRLSMKSASIVATFIFIGLMIFTKYLVAIFTVEAELIDAAVPSLRIVFLMTPLLAVSLIGSAYFQAIGKARSALLLTLTKQGFFLIPLILILPQYFGLNGIWISFPIADLGAAGVTYWYLRRNK
jgi:putative MATE family efflux protein